ncbi:carbon storage regulator CsrA [Actinotalea subterranea]|uniref:carbon storage regulator CsrA n=1 Tax=Actinotalea subterranea TaxID=2607497 RepID=UPI0011F02A8E|nr:carbon storage regulator CsrA [Actinotalea subterranea]
MLVLSRRVGERLIIGDNIVITVIDVRSDGVRIGIDAPREVRVTRAEILEAVTQANVEATRSADDDAVEALRALRPPTPPAPAAASGASAPETPAAQSAKPAVTPAKPAAPRR